MMLFNIKLSLTTYYEKHCADYPFEHFVIQSEKRKYLRRNIYISYKQNVNYYYFS